jgi:Domain of unknown function (DUF4397)
MFRQSHLLVAIIPLAFAAACGDKENGTIIVPGGTIASVRFVNATNLPIAITNNGSLVTSSNGLLFGGQSSCMTIDASGTNPLVLTNASTNLTLTGFTPAFTPGGTFMVVAFPDANGTTQFATLSNAFTPTSGSAAIRIFNAAPGSGTVTLMGNGTALGTGVSFGNAGAFVIVPSGTEAVTINNGSTVLVNAGTLNFTPGTLTTLVIGPAANGTTTLRSFTATGC